MSDEDEDFKSSKTQRRGRLARKSKVKKETVTGQGTRETFNGAVPKIKNESAGERVEPCEKTSSDNCVKTTEVALEIGPNSVTESSQVLATSTAAKINTLSGQSRNFILDQLGNVSPSRDQPRSNLAARFSKPEPERMIPCRKLGKENSSDEKDLFFCHLCQKELTHMNSQRRAQHMNRCLDTGEQASKVIKELKSAISDCPLCGKAVKTAQSRESHIKKCAKTLDIPPEEVLVLCRQQEKAREERITSEDTLSARILTTTSSTSNQTKFVVKRRPKEPKSKFEEDVQTAIALSESLLVAPSTDREVNERARKGDKQKRQKNKEKVSEIPVLVSRNESERQRLVAGRVEALILGLSVSAPTTPVLKRTRISHSAFTVLSSSEEGAFWSLGCEGTKFPAESVERSEAYGTASLIGGDKMGLGDVIIRSDAFSKKMSPKKICSALMSPGGETLNQILVTAACDGNVCDSTTDDSFRPFADRGVNTDDYDVICTRCDVKKDSDAKTHDVSLDPLERTGFFPEIESSEDETGEKSSLVEDLAAMLSNPRCSDVRLLCRDHVTLPAHRFIFMARCPKIVESVGESVVLDLSYAREGAVMNVLNYLYTGRIQLEEEYVDDIQKIVKSFGITGLLGPLNSLRNSIDADKLTTSLMEENDVDDNIDDNDVAEIYEFMATQRIKGDSNNNDLGANESSNDVTMEKYPQLIAVERSNSAEEWNDSESLKRNDLINMSLPSVGVDQSQVTLQGNIDQSTSWIQNEPPAEFLSPEMNDRSINLFDDSLIENPNDVTNGSANLELDLETINDIEKVLFNNSEQCAQDNELLPFLSPTDINDICNSPVTDAEREELDKLRTYCNSVCSPTATSDKSTQSDLDSNDSSPSTEVATSPIKAKKKKTKKEKRDGNPNRDIKKRRRRTAYDLLMAMTPVEKKEKRGSENEIEEVEPKKRKIEDDFVEQTDNILTPETIDIATPVDNDNDILILETRDNVTIDRNDDIVIESRDTKSPVEKNPDISMPKTKDVIAPVSQSRASLWCDRTPVRSPNNSVIEVILSPEPPLPIPAMTSPSSYQFTNMMTYNSPLKTIVSSPVIISSPIVQPPLVVSPNLSPRLVLSPNLSPPIVVPPVMSPVVSPLVAQSPVSSFVMKTPVPLMERLRIRNDQDRGSYPVMENIDLGPDPWADCNISGNESIIKVVPQADHSASFKTRTPQNVCGGVPPSPFTPMPNYDAMATPQIKKKVQEVGVKAMPKKKMVALLKHIYSETHQYETDPEYGSPVQDCNKMAMTYPTTNNQEQIVQPKTRPTGAKSQRKLLKKSNKSSIQESQTNVCISSESDEEDGRIMGPGALEESFQANEEESKSQVVDRDRILKFLMENVDLYFKILRYQPLELEDLKNRLKQKGLKIGTDRLVSILDDQCITFRMKNNRPIKSKKTTVNKSNKTERC